MADVHEVEARIENLKKKRMRAEFELEKTRDEVKDIVARLKDLGLTSSPEIDAEIERLDREIAAERAEIERLLEEAGA